MVDFTTQNSSSTLSTGPSLMEPLNWAGPDLPPSFIPTGLPRSTRSRLQGSSISSRLTPVSSIGLTQKDLVGLKKVIQQTDEEEMVHEGVCVYATHDPSRQKFSRLDELVYRPCHASLRYSTPKWLVEKFVTNEGEKEARLEWIEDFFEVEGNPWGVFAKYLREQDPLFHYTNRYFCYSPSHARSCGFSTAFQQNFLVGLRAQREKCEVVLPRFATLKKRGFPKAVCMAAALQVKGRSPLSPSFTGHNIMTYWVPSRLKNFFSLTPNLDIPTLGDCWGKTSSTASFTKDHSDMETSLKDLMKIYQKVYGK